METRSKTGSLPNIVTPTAPMDEEFRFGAANVWNQEHLKKLGVTFMRNRDFNLERKLKVKESEWSQDIRDRISQLLVEGLH